MGGSVLAPRGTRLITNLFGLPVGVAGFPRPGQPFLTAMPFTEFFVRPRFPPTTARDSP